jgi:hypothetical protein
VRTYGDAGIACGGIEQDGGVQEENTPRAYHFS